MLPVAPGDADLQECRVPRGVHGMQEKRRRDTLQVYVVLPECMWILLAGFRFRTWEGSQNVLEEDREIGKRVIIFYLLCYREGK